MGGFVWVCGQRGDVASVPCIVSDARFERLRCWYVEARGTASSRTGIVAFFGSSGKVP